MLFLLCGLFGPDPFQDMLETQWLEEALARERLEQAASQAIVISGEQSTPVPYACWFGDRAHVIIAEQPHMKQLMKFALTFTWSGKTTGFINARAENKLNEANDPNYDGPYEIFKSPAFGKHIKEQRCVIPVRFFIEGPEDTGLKKTPHLVYHVDKPIFYLGGIWRYWIDEKTGEVIPTFAIVTTPPTKLILERIKHHRSPVVLDDEGIDLWLNPKVKTEAELRHLFKPFDSTHFDCFQIPGLKRGDKAPEKFKKIAAIS